MVDYLLLLPLLSAFVFTILFMPFWVKKARDIGLVWKDMNKNDSANVSGSGGIVVILGFILGVFLFVAYRTFYLKSNIFLIEILSATLVVVLLAGIGFIDDLFGWQKGGLSIRSRLPLILLASIPLVVINAGRHTIGLPFLGQVNLSIIYPLVVIPIGILGSTAFNFLAGMNGLEAGQGIIILSSLGLVSFLTGNSILTMVAFCMVAALVGFILFNFYPARVFPGDVLTYPIGGLIAITAILGNFEKIAVFFFIPYIAEVILKLRGRLNKYSFGKPNKDGSLDLVYPKIYGLTHFAIYSLKKVGVKPTEKKVVYFIWGLQVIVIVLGLILFKRDILI